MDAFMTCRKCGKASCVTRKVIQLVDGAKLTTYSGGCGVKLKFRGTPAWPFAPTKEEGD